MVYAPGLTPAAVLDKLGTIQIDRRLHSHLRWPLVDTASLYSARSRSPDSLAPLHLELPAQPPPRITAAAIASVANTSR